MIYCVFGNKVIIIFILPTNALFPDPPRKAKCRHHFTSSSTEYRTASIVCTVQGNPSPEIQWTDPVLAVITEDDPEKYSINTKVCWPAKKKLYKYFTSETNVLYFYKNHSSKLVLYIRINYLHILSVFSPSKRTFKKRRLM